MYQEFSNNTRIRLIISNVMPRTNDFAFLRLQSILKIKEERAREYRQSAHVCLCAMSASVGKHSLGILGHYSTAITFNAAHLQLFTLVSRSTVRLLDALRNSTSRCNES